MMKYTFTRLLVSDFKSCFRFYRDTMGFVASFGTEDGSYADFVLGDVSLALFDQLEMSRAINTDGKPSRADVQDSICLVFEVESVDETFERLRQMQVDIIVGPTDHPDWGIRTAHFRDPDGNLIEINQSLKA
jgi:lactoylglutathione lyase